MPSYRSSLRPTSLTIHFATALLMATTSVGAADNVAGKVRAVRFDAADGVTVHADHYPARDSSAPIVLLFHQARSNRGEYREIAPRLVELGFQALALDQRSGDERWGLENQTVNAQGRSVEYLAARPDLDAAITWAQSESGSTGPVIIWGSSYSAALVFLVAADHRDDVAAVLSFSPGEYLGTDGLVSAHAAKVHQPVLILAPAGEREQATGIFDSIPHDDKTLEIPMKAVHGASMLIAARNAAADDIWPRVESFLARFKGDN